MSSVPSQTEVPKKRGRKPKVVEETITTVTTVVRTIPETAKEEKKPRKKAIPKVVKDLTWKTHIGDDIAKTKCLCCGQNEIKMNSFHCGHVVAESAGGSNTVDNLRPVCASCNLSMGAQNMNEFMKEHNFPIAAAAAAPAPAPAPTPVPVISVTTEQTPVKTSTTWNKIRPRGCAAFVEAPAPAAAPAAAAEITYWEPGILTKVDKLPKCLKWKPGADSIAMAREMSHLQRIYKYTEGDSMYVLNNTITDINVENLREGLIYQNATPPMFVKYPPNWKFTKEQCKDIELLRLNYVHIAGLYIHKHIY
jgi:hypothetical protein